MNFQQLSNFQDPKDTMLRKYQEEISRLRSLLESQSSPVLLDRPITSGSILSESTTSEPITNGEIIKVQSLDEQRDTLIHEYQTEMQVLKNLHANEKLEKETIIKQMENIKKEYNDNLERLNNEIKQKKQEEEQQKNVSKEEIMKR